MLRLSTTPRSKRVLPKPGFALVITLSLMILLALLAVGLLSLSAIALRSSSQGSTMAIARSNARLAMMFALAELQKSAGPDQRVTGTADLAGGADGVRLGAGKAPVNIRSINNVANGLSSVVPGTRYWTAVWETVTSSTPANQVYTKTPSAANVRWLISGNEMDPSGKNTNTPADNHLAVDQSGAVSNPETVAVLVGRNTVGSSEQSMDNYVSAPLVEVNIEPQTGATTRGRYAWWIGDEGVKTRFNVATRSAPGQKGSDGNLLAQRGGWEVVNGLQRYPTPDDVRHGWLDKAVTMGEAALLDRSLRLSSGSPVAAFHSATADSFGVLADSLQGGLRVDLTACLENGFPQAAASTFPNLAVSGRNIIPTTADRTVARLKGPRWDTLKNFYSEAKLAQSENKLTVKGGGTSGYGITIAPILLDVRVVLGARLVQVNGTNCKLHPCAKVAVALANPYPYTLEWKEDLELEIIDETPSDNGLDTAIYAPGGMAAWRFLGRKGTGNSGPGLPYEPAVLNNAHFVIPKGELPPGEARAWVQSRTVVRPVNDSGAAKVSMAPFSGSSASNFEVCVEMMTADGSAIDFSSARQIDVREGWTTSQPTVELRLAGRSAAGNILRRIERFEWDNCFHAATKLSINSQAVTQYKMPFPLKIYNNHISLPGGDYDRLGQLPEAGMMGTRNSTLRTFMDFNVRASKFGKLITSYNPPPYYFDQTDNAITDIPPTPIYASTPAQTGQAFVRNMSVSPQPWGHSLKTSPVTKTILFTFPKQLVSLAQLQHVDLTADDEAVSISQQPGNAFGNSYASPFVKRGVISQARNNYVVTGVNTNDINRSAIKSAANYFDMSYLVNAAIWDTYFLSTMDNYSGYQSATAGMQGGPLNPAMAVAFPPEDPSALKDPIRASSHLLVRGSFNVNSTSKDAWKALLASNRFRSHPGGGDENGAMFPRSMEQTSPSAENPTGNGPDSFSGYRRLTPAQIDAVAEELVKQIRQRGPFVSLSHFVNRTLVTLNSRRRETIMLSRSGPLQAALDLGGVNISPDGKLNAFRNTKYTDDRLKIQAEGSAPRADVLYPSGGGFPSNQPNGSRGSTYGGEETDGSPVWAPTSADLNFGAMASIYADRTLLTDRNLQTEQGCRSTGIPGWLTQADVLQAIGPLISARSDTFRIRTYGEALSPDGKTVLARAWCEAIVQRTPHYVDPANSPEQRDASLTDRVLSPLNKRFGRRFEIVSIRWLNHDEI